MNSNPEMNGINPDLLTQIKQARPEAPARLRAEVRELASRPPAPGPFAWLDAVWAQLWSRKPLLVLAPVTLALVAAVAIGLSHSPAPQQTAQGGANGLLTDSGVPGAPVEAAPTLAPNAKSSAGSAATKGFATPGVTTPGIGTQSGRPQKFSATMILEVTDLSALSQATVKAMQVAQSLGGFAQSVNYSSSSHPRQTVTCPIIYADGTTANSDGTTTKATFVPPYCPGPDGKRAGLALITVKVPTGKVLEALTRLSALGTITDQQITLEDLATQNSALATQAARYTDQIAQLRGQLASAKTATERTTLRSQLTDAENQLAALTDQQTQNTADVRYATISMTVETPVLEGTKAKGPVHHGRIHQRLVKAWDVIVWELLAAVYVLVVTLPILIVGVLGFFVYKTTRRRRDQRLLEEK
jgi:hypothetical protein